MTIKKSKPYTIEGVSFAGGKVNYDFQDNKLIGIKKLNSNNVFQPISRTDPDFEKSISGDNLSSVVRASNIVKHGEDKQAYEDTFERSSDEEIDARYDQTYQSFLNAGFVDNNFDKPKPLAYAIGKSRDGYQHNKKNQKSGLMAYPLDINPEQDHFKISRYDYRRPTINQSKPAGTVATIKGEKNVAGDSVKGSKLMGSILLPMPKATDVNGVEWGKSELTVTGLLALDATQKAIAASGAIAGGTAGFLTGGPVGALVGGTLGAGLINTDGKTREERALDRQAKREGGRTSALQDLMNIGAGTQATNVQNLTNLVGGALGGELDADTVLARTGGRVLNPNAEMLFQGPVIRDFAFSFIMIARSKKEGDEIRKIIHFLKKGMAPKFRNTSFLASPDIFTLEYKNGTGSKDILKTVNRFNPGGLALTTMNVDYAPNGYWSAYMDSQPVAVKMDLSFTELRPIYEGDQTISELEGTVGY